MKERILLSLPAALIVAGMISCNASPVSGQKHIDSTAMIMSTSIGTAIQEPVEKGIEVGDAIMVTRRSIFDNLSRSKDHTTLMVLLSASGFAGKLKGHDPYTLFAPTNKALNQLPAGTVDSLLRPNHKRELLYFVQSHLAGRSFSLKELEQDPQAVTLSGMRLHISHKQDTWWINKARISIPDVASSNGAIFVTEAVLTP